jgi:hypothetical protein
LRSPSSAAADTGGALVALVPPVTAPHRLWPTGDPARDVGREPVRGDPSCTAPPPADRFAPHGVASVQTIVRGLVNGVASRRVSRRGCTDILLQPDAMGPRTTSDERVV